jgi:DNA-binding NarL/FixJ family response regulator
MNTPTSQTRPTPDSERSDEPTVGIVAHVEALRIGLTRMLATRHIRVVHEAAMLDDIARPTFAPANVLVVDSHLLCEGDAFDGDLALLQGKRIVVLIDPSIAKSTARALIQRLLVADCFALLATDSDGQRLVDAIRLVAAGKIVCDAGVMRPLLDCLIQWSGDHCTETAARTQLSGRERDVLALVGQGLSNRRIAEEMVIAEGTVKAHVSHILAKLSIDNRQGLVRYALTEEFSSTLESST